MKFFLITLLVTFSAVLSTAEVQEGFIYLGSYTPGANGKTALAATTTSHYYLSLTATDWYTADFVCIGLNSKLVAIEDAAENAALKNFMSLNRALNVDLWTSGYYDGASQSYLWESTGAFVAVDAFGHFVKYLPYHEYYLTIRNDRSSTYFDTWYGEERMRYICESQS